MAYASILDWYNTAGDVIHYATTNKRVRLLGHYVRGTPTFTILKKNKASWVPGLPRILKTTRVASMPTHRLKKIVEGDSRLRVGHGLKDITGQSRYYFQDGRGHRSGDLNVFTIGNAIFEKYQHGDTKGGVGAWVPITEGIAAGAKIERDGGGYIRINGEIIVPTDPELNLDLVTSWGRGDEDIRPHIEKSILEAVEGHAILGRLPVRLRELFFRRAVEITKPWMEGSREYPVEASLSESRVEASEGEPAGFTITLFFSRPGRALIALRARDPQRPNEPILSDPLPVYAVEVEDSAHDSKSA